VLLSIQPAHPTQLASKWDPQLEFNASARSKEDHDVDAALESLPLEADGFDWTEKETELNDVADGMAALSINPEGAGYLGRVPRFQFTALNVNTARCNIKCGASSSTDPERRKY
jgi:hypothetical protein